MKLMRTYKKLASAALVAGVALSLTACQHADPEVLNRLEVVEQRLDSYPETIANLVTDNIQLSREVDSLSWEVSQLEERLYTCAETLRKGSPLHDYFIKCRP